MNTIESYKNYESSNKKIVDNNIIGSFNDEDYDDLIRGSVEIGNSNIYSSDYSNIYNNYVKANVLDLASKRYQEKPNNNTYYLNSKCRGWKKQF
jgi:hypothetical protein